MLALSGYNWSVIRVIRRPEYLAALEQASVHRQLADFTRFLPTSCALSSVDRVPQ